MVCYGIAKVCGIHANDRTSFQQVDHIPHLPLQLHRYVSHAENMLQLRRPRLEHTPRAKEGPGTQTELEKLRKSAQGAARTGSAWRSRRWLAGSRRPRQESQSRKICLQLRFARAKMNKHKCIRDTIGILNELLMNKCCWIERTELNEHYSTGSESKRTT